MEVRSGSIFIRQSDHLLETGTIIAGHKHNFDHTTFFGSGLWKVECFGDVYGPDGKLVTQKVMHDPFDGSIGSERTEFDPPPSEIDVPLRVKLREITIKGGAPGSFVLIEADKMHTLTLLEGPGTYACIYSHRTHDGDVTPEYTGWHPAYV